MALKISYKIRKKLASRSEEDVAISFRMTDSNRLDLTLATPFSIPYRYWDDKAGWIKDGIMTSDKALFDNLTFISDRLKGLRQALYDEYFKCETFTKDDAREVMEQYIRSAAEEATREKEKEERVKLALSIPDYVDGLVARMKSGLKRVGGQTYTKGTIKAWGSFSRLMREFCSDFKESYGRELTWDDFNKDGYSLFIGFMEKREYLNTSINKYIVDLNAMIVCASEDGMLGDIIIRKHCPRKFIRQDESPVKIYLTDDELQALFEMELPESSEKCKVRDIFLCGAYTGQRISDYNNLSPENFKKTPKGYDIVMLIQEKTNSAVVIPVLNRNLLTIASKYNFELPRVVEQVLNRYIKEICKALSERVPSLKQMYPTVLTMKERKAEADGKVKFERNAQGQPLRPKYDLITSHTARRSCITNLYLQGRFTNEQIMSISGHKDEKTFKAYIVCSGVTIAEKIVEINNRKSNADLFM